MEIPSGRAQPVLQTWGSKRPLDKYPILKKMLGFRPAMEINWDDSCMRKYLNNGIAMGLQDPKLSKFHDYFPTEAPLLDSLAVYQENMAAWKYPKKEEICFMQLNRDLNLEMIDKV